MVQKNLVNYVRDLLQKGYDVTTIRNVLLKYGYSNNDVNDAINSIYRPTIRHEIHLSHTTAFLIIFIFISLLGTASFFYYTSSKSPEQLLDLNLEPVTTTVAPGDNAVFLKEISNLGSSKKYDVVIKQEIIDAATSKAITEKTETRAIETFGSTRTNILIPKNTLAGDYILRVIVEYDNKKAVATLPIKVGASAKNKSCFDGMQNQNEEGIDCGGACKPCEQAPKCGDNNACTNDVVENGICAYKPIIPCCGNYICEEQEQTACISDCKEQPAQSYPIPTQTLEDIKGLAKINPSKALQECNKIEVPDLKDTCISSIGEAQRNRNYCKMAANIRIKDLCHSTIAKLANDNSICEEISTDGRKDSCYMTFVLDNKDYSVCAKIVNTQLRQSCESLRQLSEISMPHS